jgi:hypothetical protein
MLRRNFSSVVSILMAYKPISVVNLNLLHKKEGARVAQSV